VAGDMDVVLRGASGGFASGFSTDGCDDSGCDCSDGVCGLRVLDEERFAGFEYGWKATE